ncbi:MAG: DUF3990 domain-containing protein [Erysipelotrichaceae bacterium]|nr:DUF3990 domain-containing protein [Erysipelotrichaceae bacterium]
MIIYHGSKTIIDKPIVGGSDPKNDYGAAFYLSLDLDAAKSWACKHDSLGVVNKYLIRNETFQSLKILDLTNKDKYSVLNWMAILMHFRELSDSFIKTNKLVLDWLEKYYIDVTQYDVVIGYRADDSYFRFPIRFISNDLAFEDLENIFLLGHLGVQYAFISSRAINALKFIEAIDCEPSYLGHYRSLVVDASKVFDEVLSTPRDPSKTYILDLMRKDNE